MKFPRTYERSPTRAALAAKTIKCCLTRRTEPYRNANPRHHDYFSYIVHGAGCSTPNNIPQYTEFATSTSNSESNYTTTVVRMMLLIINNGLVREKT